MENSSREITDYRDVIIFEKLGFQDVAVHTKSQSRCFQIPRFEERFRRAPFS